MATSSIFEAVKITDPKVAQAFVDALEASERAQKENPRPKVKVHMATHEERMRLFELRRKNRTGNKSQEA